MTSGLNFSRRLRRSPYTACAESMGLSGYSVVNHMLLPKAYARSVEEDYWHLREHVQLWDVACQRQVEITGPDASTLVQLMTPRNIQSAQIGDCYYLPLTDEKAGLINDPVMLKLDENRFWLSIADSDVLLFAKGLSLGYGLHVEIDEPDVSPLAIQGPKSENLMADLFGERIRQLKFFKFDWFEFNGTQQLIARSGYSRQDGFEIYLQGEHLGSQLWQAVWQAGEPYQITPGCPNLIERIEGGLLSYGNEMTRANNPLEMGMEKFCDLDEPTSYLGRDRLREIAANGIARKICGIVFNGGPCPACASPWEVSTNNQFAGIVTSAIWSPRLHANVGLALIERHYWNLDQEVVVQDGMGKARSGQIARLPIE